MKIINKIKEIIHRIKDYNRLEKEYNLLIKSEKVVVVHPMVKIEGLDKMKGPLFLKGENCEISNVTMNIHGGENVPATTCVMGEHMTFLGCIWNAGPNKYNKKK